MNLLKQFAEKHRIRIRQRADGERVLTGRDGEIYQPNSTHLGVIFMPSKWTPRRWNAGRATCTALGMTCAQDGDSEGTLLFDPTNSEQGKAAVKLAHIRRKRQMTTEQAEAAAKRLEAMRQNRAVTP